MQSSAVAVDSGLAQVLQRKGLDVFFVEPTKAFGFCGSHGKLPLGLRAHSGLSD